MTRFSGVRPESGGKVVGPSFSRKEKSGFFVAWVDLPAPISPASCQGWPQGPPDRLAALTGGGRYEQLQLIVFSEKMRPRRPEGEYGPCRRHKASLPGKPCYHFFLKTQPNHLSKIPLPTTKNRNPLLQPRNLLGWRAKKAARGRFSEGLARLSPAPCRKVVFPAQPGGSLRPRKSMAANHTEKSPGLQGCKPDFFLLKSRWNISKLSK